MICKAGMHVHAAASDERAPSCGLVYLVGAGPGDPELLTLRAAHLLECADVVLYDHLVSAGVRRMVGSGALLLCVGKRCGRHSMPQSEINRMLIRFARAGRTVVRLKGGDPLVFGRGGEELEALVRANVRFEIVPGVSAANGVAAYAGIPLTHRDLARSCLLVTAHAKDGGIALDWAAAARPDQTLVVYMGLAALPQLARELIAHGLAADTPAALIEQGTTSAQRVLTAPLAELPAIAAAAGATAPALTIIGEVVRFAAPFAWFHPRACAPQLPEVA